jgi:hypothetical protein
MPSGSLCRGHLAVPLSVCLIHLHPFRSHCRRAVRNCKPGDPGSPAGGVCLKSHSGHLLQFPFGGLP